MKIQYLTQSGFLIELETCIILMDYWHGTLPEIDPNKDLFIFVSHRHRDHYNRNIWFLRNRPGRTIYIIAKEIPFSAKQQELLGLTLGQKQEEKYLIYKSPDLAEENTFVIRTKPREIYDLREEFGIYVETLRSTDEGVAFYFEIEGQKIYHAGDLNNWIWEEEVEEVNKEMEKAYLEELDLFTKKELNLAFVPVDPRQGSYMGKGFIQFLERFKVKDVFPMHFWKSSDKLHQFIDEISLAFPETSIKQIYKSGVIFYLP